MAEFKSISNFLPPHKSTVVWRPAQEADHPFILQASQIFERFGPYVEIVKEWLIDPWIKTWVLEVEGKEAGFLMLGPLLPSYFRATVDIMAILVAPPFRRRGFGKLMLSLAAREAKQAGYLYLRAHVACDNKPACFLFKRAGFRIIKKIDNYYPSGQSAYEFRKKLTKT